MILRHKAREFFVMPKVERARITTWASRFVRGRIIELLFDAFVGIYRDAPKYKAFVKAALGDTFGKPKQFAFEFVSTLISLKVY